MKEITMIPKGMILPGYHVFGIDNSEDIRIWEEAWKLGESFCEGYKPALDAMFGNGTNKESLTGSNFIFNNIVNKVLPKGQNVITVKDLEIIYNIDSNYFEGYSANTTNSILRSEIPSWDNNKKFLEELVKITKKEGFKDFSNENPLIFYNLEFKLDKSGDNFYGLLPKFGQDTQIEYDVRFASSKNKIFFEEIEKKSWTKEEGLSGLCADDKDRVISNYSNLCNSDNDSWLVVFNAGNVLKNLKNLKK